MAFLFKSVFSFNSSTVCHWSFPKAHCHSSPHCLLSSSLIIPWVEWNLEFFCSISLSPALTVTVDMDKASAQTMKDASKFKTYVSANPYARSSISSSSSVGFCGNSLKFCWLNIKWHVEHANVPSHAPETHAYRVAPQKLARLLYAPHFFHCQNEKMCNSTITKDLTTPKICNYTTLWNVSVLEQQLKTRLL